MSTSDQPSEDELRAAYEAELKKIRVEQILLEQVVTLINLGMRRTGLSPGTEEERDIGQVRLAIEGVRTLLPIVEPLAGAQAPALRDALSQLQLAYVRLGGSPEAGGGGPGGPSAGGGPGDGPGGPGGGPGGPGGGPGGGLGGPGGGPGGPGGGPGGPGGGPGGGAPGREPSSPPEPERPRPGEPGPAQRSGRLWIPGQ